MVKNKSVSRKKLLKEPDEFITVSSKVLGFVVANKVKLYWVLGMVIAIAVLMYGIRYFIDSAENNAFNILDQLMMNYGSVVKEKGAVNALSDVDKDFQELLDKYGGRKGGKYARLYYGDICFDAGEYDKAIVQYQQALKDFRHIEPFENLILKNIGYSYEEKKDFSAAAAHFEKIVSQPNLLMKDEVLFSLARIYTVLEQKEKSADMYKEIIDKYPDSMFIDIAKEKVLN